MYDAINNKLLKQNSWAWSGEENKSRYYVEEELPKLSPRIGRLEKVLQFCAESSSNNYGKNEKDSDFQNATMSPFFEITWNPFRS